jgi:hypothetical protein
MISISRENGLVTVINVFACEPSEQEQLVNVWRDAAKEFGELPGVVSASLHRSLDGTCTSTR